MIKEKISEKEFKEKVLKLYKQGLNLIKDKNPNYKKAFELFKEACDLGNDYALASLGKFYMQGIIVKKDIKKAIYYYKLGVKQKNPKAAYYLSVTYLEGIGVRKNLLKGRDYNNIMVDLAIERINQNDSLIKDFLLEEANYTEDDIFEITKGLKSKKLYCALCGRNIYLNNRFHPYNPMLEGEEKINKEYPSINWLLKADPIVKDAYCCNDCYLKVIAPLKTGLKYNCISKSKIDERLNRKNLDSRRGALFGLTFYIAQKCNEYGISFKR